ncbi:hypothetical protein [Amycolatopsis plumensis]
MPGPRARWVALVTDQDDPAVEPFFPQRFAGLRTPQADSGDHERRRYHR